MVDGISLRWTRRLGRVGILVQTLRELHGSDLK